MVELELVAHMLLVVELQLGIEHLSYGHGAFDGLWYMIHVLRLDQRFQVILEDLGEVVLQLGAAEVLEDFLPIWWILTINNTLTVFLQ